MDFERESRQALRQFLFGRWMEQMEDYMELIYNLRHFDLPDLDYFGMYVSEMHPMEAAHVVHGELSSK